MTRMRSTNIKRAAASSDRQAATEAKLLEIALRQKRNEISQDDVLRELETLSVTWRGDALEVQTLEMLARIYAETGRYAKPSRRRASPTRLQPNSELSRQGQDERRRCSRSSFSVRRATTFRRSTRWRCSTNIAN